MTIPLGPGAEFDLIRSLVERWGPRARGIGDDAAVFRPTRGDSIVASVDASVEGRHFDSAWLSPREIGYRAVTAALSDLAAMGARPRGILVAIALSENWQHKLLNIANGIGDAVDAAQTVILGGNLSAARELSFTTTVFGEAFEPLRRSGAMPGDRVYVPGRLGGVGEALRRLKAGESAAHLRERFAKPTARLEEGRWLAGAGVNAAIDISDGLVADLRHLAAASAVDIEISADRIVLMPGTDIEGALVSGEEYELAVTSPKTIDLRAFETAFGIPLTEIGRVIARGTGNVGVIGARVAARAGHDHFSR
jgi:thiamine-monophosphate kinase